MSLNYVNPINAAPLIILNDKRTVENIASYINPHISGDIIICKNNNEKRAVAYSWIIEEICAGAYPTLEIPIVNRKKYSIENLTVSYIISNMIPDFTFEEVMSSVVIYEGTISENYIKLDLSSTLSKVNIETDFMITFIVQCDAPKDYHIGAYALEQNLENISIKVASQSTQGAATYALRRTVSEGNENTELTDAEKFVDKYYTSWEEDILNSELVMRDYDKYTLSTNNQISFIDNKDTGAKSIFDIYLDDTLTDKEVTYNKYGSIVDESNKQEATGYFYIKVVAGRAWVVDPEGYLNVIKNVAFPLPRLNTPHPNQISSDTVEAYNNDEWKNKTELNMKTLAFNTYEQFYTSINNNEFTYNMNVISKFPLLHSWAQFKNLNKIESRGLRNIFDPHFKFKLKWKIEKMIFENDTHRNDNVVAYILDNEPSFHRDDLIVCLLTTDPNLVYRKEAALRWMNNRYGITQITVSQVTNEMCDEFISFEFYIYSKIITELIRAVDSNHMIFSPIIQWFKFSDARGFLKNNDNFFKVVNKFYDALSISHYSTYDVLNDVINDLRLNIPVFLNEFSMKSYDENNFINSMAGPIVNSQDDRGKYFEHIAYQCIKNKNCIGYTWYQYSDIQCEEGILNRGIVDNNNNIYEDLGNHMRKINTNAEGLRV